MRRLRRTFTLDTVITCSVWSSSSLSHRGSNAFNADNSARFGEITSHSCRPQMGGKSTNIANTTSSRLILLICFPEGGGYCTPCSNSLPEWASQGLPAFDQETLSERQTAREDMMNSIFPWEPNFVKHVGFETREKRCESYKKVFNFNFMSYQWLLRKDGVGLLIDLRMCSLTFRCE
jgi:hypothetical protein